ncbi:hypothetical protein TWF718_007713 [Orbilia javanica]|uniref:Protein kinase domain-containing protein n=1 Tax=Orbilia javanica TaxID=47235 RepID=A0AAN8RH29_9PEZI
MNLSQFLDDITLPEIRKAPSRSTTRTTVPAHPRDYLSDLTPWVGLDEDIERFFSPHLSLKAQRFSQVLDNIKIDAERKRLCGNEAHVVALGTLTYEAATLAILDQILPIKCDFSDHQSTLNIGDPDRVFYELTDNETQRSKAKFLMEWKTPWALETQEDIIEHFNSHRGDATDKVVKAISQLYGYMTFNNLINGGLSNYDTLYLLRRTGDIGLEISRPFRYNDRGIRSPVAALTYICHYATTVESFHYSPVDKGPVGTHTFVLEDLDVEGTWDKYIEVPWKEMRLKLTSAVSKNIASVMAGEVIAKPGSKFRYSTTAFFKVYDITTPTKREAANAEIKAYTNLETLQGKYIARLYAAGTSCGSLKFLILEDCGKTPWEESVDETFWAQARKAIQSLHKQGYIHGDVKPNNLATSKRGVRLIDLGACRRGSLADQSGELLEFDRLRREWEEEQEDNAD